MTENSEIMTDSEGEIDLTVEDFHSPDAKSSKSMNLMKRKKKAFKESRAPGFHLKFSSQQEAELVQWVEKNPVLYNSKVEDFRDRGGLKNEIYEEKAKLFPNIEGCTGATLEKWVVGMRTQYGKLEKKRSGSAGHRYTAREMWVLKAFDFMEPFIVRRRSKLSKASGNVQMDADSDFNAFDSDTSSVIPEPPRLMVPPKRREPRPLYQNPQMSSVETNLVEADPTMINLLKLQRDDLVPPEEAELHCFLNMMKNRIKTFPRSVWPDVQAELYTHLLQLRFDPRFQERGFLTLQDPKAEP